TVQKALIAAVPSLAGNIVVSGSQGFSAGGYTIQFINSLANRNEHIGFINNNMIAANTQALVEATNLTIGGLGEAVQGPAVTNTSTVNFTQVVLTTVVGQNQSAVVNTGVTTLSLDGLNTGNVFAANATV